MSNQRPPPNAAPRLLPVSGLPYDERTIHELGTSPPLLAGAFGFPATDYLSDKIDAMLPSLTAWLRDVEFIDGDHWSVMVDTVTLIRLARDHDVDQVIFSNIRPERGALQGVTDGYLPEVLSLWHIVDIMGSRGNAQELNLVDVLHTWCFMRLYECMLLWADGKGLSRRKFPFFIAINPPRYDATWIHPDVLEAMKALDETSSLDSDEVEQANDLDEYLRQHRRKSRSPSEYSAMASLDRYFRSMPHLGELFPKSRRDSPLSPVTKRTSTPVQSIKKDTDMYPASRDPTPPPGSTARDTPMRSPDSTITGHSSPRSESDCARPSSLTLSEEPSPPHSEEPAPPLPPRRRPQLWKRASWERPTPGRKSSPFGSNESVFECDLEGSPLEFTPPRLPSPMIPLDEPHLAQDGTSLDIPIRGGPASSSHIYREGSPILTVRELSYLKNAFGSTVPAKRRRSRSPE